EAAEVVAGQPARVLASDREVTRLGESVFRSGSVSEQALRESCVVLARMAELYRRLDVVGVRAVATSAIRDTRNQREFLARASEAAGTSVEIISGREEARLIHLGVENNWPQAGKRVLILDIGGGSAELIAAEDGRLREAFSKPLGAVRLHEIFLTDDPPAARQLHQMHEFIQEKLNSALTRLGQQGWNRAIATSATASAVASAVARIPRAKRDEIDRLRIPTTQVRRLYRKLSVLNLAGRRKVTGIGPRRAEIIVPGIAVLLEFLERFRLPAVYYSRAGVRDGIIADLAARNVGAELSRLSRDQRREVEDVGRRFGVPQDHARSVAHISAALFTALHPLHQLPPACGKLLEAAAHLLDVGHYISSSSHHKHSYYVVWNSDMPGFTERERLLIACLCRYHRKSLPGPMHNTYQSLAAEEKRQLMLLIPILRLADNLVRSHEHRIESLECRLVNGEAVLQVRSHSSIDLEQWGAERAAEAFHQVYNHPVRITKAKE
ncbi:MAG TPA: Ppx/GppA phosphatase family protein, partial [Candidatus Sulfopaludibacter sp.]|nr:Ppx/GppA phosphatase family protein [Candidatus Sulfopaludibacter sp.]